MVYQKQKPLAEIARKEELKTLPHHTSQEKRLLPAVALLAPGQENTSDLKEWERGPLWGGLCDLTFIGLKGHTFKL